MHLSLESGKCDYQYLVEELKRLGVRGLVFKPPDGSYGNSFLGEYHGKKVSISLRSNLMKLYMNEHFEEVIGIFSEILNLQPFCQYKVRMENYLVEWSPEESMRQKRLKDLRDKKSCGLIEGLSILQS